MSKKEQFLITVATMVWLAIGAFDPFNMALPEEKAIPAIGWMVLGTIFFLLGRLAYRSGLGWYYESKIYQNTQRTYVPNSRSHHKVTKRK